jgi:hypothetical protein
MTVFHVAAIDCEDPSIHYYGQIMFLGPTTFEIDIDVPGIPTLDLFGPYSTTCDGTQRLFAVHGNLCSQELPLPDGRTEVVCFTDLTGYAYDGTADGVVDTIDGWISWYACVYKEDGSLDECPIACQGNHSSYFTGSIWGMTAAEAADSDLPVQP